MISHEVDDLVDHLEASVDRLIYGNWGSYSAYDPALRNPNWGTAQPPAGYHWPYGSPPGHFGSHPPAHGYADRPPTYAHLAGNTIRQHAAASPELA
jgi:hypothetical protein